VRTRSPGYGDRYIVTTLLAGTQGNNSFRTDMPLAEWPRQEATSKKQEARLAPHCLVKSYVDVDVDVDVWSRVANQRKHIPASRKERQARADASAKSTCEAPPVPPSFRLVQPHRPHHPGSPLTGQTPTASSQGSLLLVRHQQTPRRIPTIVTR
jgi:hypothetical protein